MVTSREKAAFLADIISSSLLEESIDWIKYNLNPEDVFDESELREWAEDNGYIQEEEGED